MFVHLYMCTHKQRCMFVHLYMCTHKERCSVYAPLHVSLLQTTSGLPSVGRSVWQTDLPTERKPEVAVRLFDPIAGNINVSREGAGSSH